jgi:hypothetical protein
VMRNLEVFGHWPRWKVAQRLGRRGAILLSLGVMDTIFALAAYSQPVRASGSGAEVLLLFPQHVWAGTWAAVAALCFGQAWSRNDAWAFAAAILIKWTYGIAFLVAYWQTSLYRGWASFAFWFIVGFVVLIIAGWTEQGLERADVEGTEALVQAEEVLRRVDTGEIPRVDE